MSSDSEDDEQMKQFLEAADTTLLKNAMFQGKLENKSNNEEETSAKLEEQQVELTLQDHKVKSYQKDLLKSQRYISDDLLSNATDFNLPESMQKHIAKKLTEILKQAYEFYDASIAEPHAYKKKCRTKSRLKLLNGDESYVNAYEDFEYETKGPKTKPHIKKRCVDKEELFDKNEILNSVTIDGVTILSGVETKRWARKKERKNKIFYYKSGLNGVLHAKEEINEFTTARRKNKWNERKIKDFKIKKIN